MSNNKTVTFAVFALGFALLLTIAGVAPIYAGDPDGVIGPMDIDLFKCLEKGLSAKTIEGNILTLRPALVITRDEMDRAIDIIDEAIGEVEQGKKY